MKRIILAVLCFAVIISSACFAFADETADNTYYIDYLKKLNIIDDAYPEEYEYVTRGQVAFYVSKLYGEEFGTDTELGRYSDTDIDNPYFQAIELLSVRQIMVGYSDGRFYPDKPVTQTELIKVIMGFLGYTYEAKLNGGYPSGYLYSANKTGLLKGVPYADGYVDCGTLAHFIYNALFIDLALPAGITFGDTENYENIEIVKGKTVMTEYLKLYNSKGTVTANNYISIADKTAEKGCLIIDNESYVIEDSSYNEYVGYTVEFVYCVDETVGKKNIKIIEPESKNEIREFNFCGSHIFEVDGLTLKYYENNKEQKLTISPVADIVYNFRVIPFAPELFDNEYCQYFKFIDNDGDKKIDFISIEVLKSMVVGTVNTTSGVVTDKFKASVSLTLSEEKYENLMICDGQGNEIKKEQISEGTVLTYATSGNVMKCYVSFDVVTGRIDSVDKVEQTVYVADGKDYTLFPMSKLSSGYLGKSVKMYLDAFGFVVNISENQTAGLKRGYLISVHPRVRNNEEEYIISIFTEQDAVETFFAADMVRINGKSTKLTALPATMPQTLVLYELNEEGKIKTLETPVDDKDYETGRLRRSYTKQDEAGKILSSYHYNVQKAFDQTLAYDDNTTVFDVVRLPAGTPLSEEYISIRTFGFSERTSYLVEGYNYSEDGMVTDIIVNWVTYKTGGSIPNEDNLLVVSEITVIYDEEEGFAKTVLEGFSLGKPVKFDVKYEYVKELSSMNFQKGDILRYAVNSANEITLVEKILDLSDGCTWKDYSYPEGVSVAGNPRFVLGRVVAFDSRYVRYITPTNYNSFSGFLGECFATRTNYMPNITIIEKGNAGNFIIRSGSKLTDIEPGDFILEYTTQQQLRDSVIFKGFDKI